MPIDRKLLRIDPDARAQLEHSIQLRFFRRCCRPCHPPPPPCGNHHHHHYHNNNEEEEKKAADAVAAASKQWIQLVLDQDLVVRTALQQIATLRQAQNNNNNQRRQQQQQTKKKENQQQQQELLLQIQEQYEQAQDDLHRVWWPLPNYYYPYNVPEQTRRHQEGESRTVQTQQHPEEPNRHHHHYHHPNQHSYLLLCEDPLFCLGGYVPLTVTTTTDTKTATTTTTNTNTIPLWTECGRQWYDALQHAMMQWYRSGRHRSMTAAEERAIQTLYLPSQLEVSYETYQQRWGGHVSRNHGNTTSNDDDTIQNHLLLPDYNNTEQKERNAASGESRQPQILPNGTRTTSFILQSQQQTETILAPSWITVMDQMHAGQTYFDRNLPLHQLLQCHGPRAHEPTTLVYHPTNKKTKKKHASSSRTAPRWYQSMEETAHNQELQVLILTGSSLEADSQPLHYELMQDLLHFYQQFLPPPTTTSTLSSSSPTPPRWQRLEIRAMQPPDLALAEANRWVLQGWLPPPPSKSSTTKSVQPKRKPAAANPGDSGGNDCDRTDDDHDDGSEPIILASVSNLLDYASFPDVRHGNAIGGRDQSESATSKKCVHVLVGSLVRPAGLEWIVQHAPATEHGIHLPSCLLTKLDAAFKGGSDSSVQRRNEISPSKAFVPFCKQIRRGKNGQRIITDFVLPPPLQTPSASDEPVVPAKEPPPLSTTTTTTTLLRSPRILAATHSASNLSLEDIRAEAISCPFDFLPFYSR